MPRKKRQKISEPEEKPKEQQRKSLFRSDSSFTNEGQRLFDRIRAVTANVAMEYYGEYPFYEIETVVHRAHFKPICMMDIQDRKEKK